MDYIRTARAKGVREGDIGHVLGAIVTILPILGLRRFFLSGSVFIEIVFQCLVLVEC